MFEAEEGSLHDWEIIRKLAEAISGVPIERATPRELLDNLLKGAATQAMQNLNLAFGFDELEGIPVEGRA